MPTPTKRLFNRRLLTDKHAFKFYRENAKHRNLENTHRREKHGLLVKQFWGKVAHHMVESEHGVFLKNFGYFTMLMNPKKGTATLKRGWLEDKLMLNPHTDGRMFHPIFLHIVNNFNFKLFIMDKSFHRDNIKMKLKEKLWSKVKYMNHYGLLNSMYKYKR